MRNPIGTKGKTRREEITIGGKNIENTFTLHGEEWKAANVPKKKGRRQGKDYRH